MPAKSYENMTIDEIDVVKTSIKNKIRELQEEANAVNAFRMAKVEQFHYEEAMFQLARVAKERGTSLEEVANDWIDDGDRGHYIQANLFLSQAGK